MKNRRALILLSALVLCVVAADSDAAAVPPAPTPLAPASGANVQVPFTISWSAVSDPAGIIGYNWQVSSSSNFTTVILQDSTNPQTTQDVVSGLANGTYFWRVQAANGAGQQGPWSQPRSFNVTGVGPGAPGTPVLGPTRGYSTFHPWEAIHFDWTAVPDAVTYRLEVSNDPSFPVGTLPPGTVTFWNDNIPTNTDGYIHTIEGNWFARVFAVNADNPQEGIRSLPSNIIQFSCFFNNPVGPPPELVSPLNNPTLTLPVTLTWAHVPNPQPMGYVLEVAKDSSFSTIEFFFNQYTEPSTVMLSLTSGPKFWRVLSQQGLSSPTTNANTAWSTTGRFTISSASPTPVSIAPLGNPEMFMYSGASGMVAVQLTAGVTPSGATIALSSSHPSAAPVPATISMPGTHAWTQFPITVGQVTSPTLVTLTATLNGVSASNQFTLRPPTLNDDIFQAAPVRATGGAAMTGWVDLEGGGLAGPGGFVVSLSTDSPAATVPATVTIPAGVGGTSFPIQTSPVTTTKIVTITASSGGVTTRWQITLTPAPAPTSLLVRPMSTTNGSQGTVTAAEGVGHDQLMQVSSSNPALAAVPDSVSVSAGSGIGFFNITTAPVTAPTTVTISVSGGGVTLSRPLTVYPSLPSLTALTVSPTNVVGGNPSTGTVTLASPAPAVGVAVNLGSNLPLAASVPESVTVPGGATSASFTVTTFPVDTTTVQLSAALDNVFQFAAVTVNPPGQAPTLSAVSLNPTSVAGGNSSTGTVTLSSAAPSGGAAVSLTDNSNAAAAPATVTVPAGATSVNFKITTTSVTAATAAMISALFNGVTRTATLTINPPPPSAPSLVSPANAATVTQPVTFDWSDASGAASYRIQIDDASTFTSPLVLNQTVTPSQLTASSLPARRLWWRVRGINAAGTAGPWSVTREFTVQSAPPPPSSPTLSALSLNPASVVGSNSSQGTVTLTSAAPSGGAVVTLSSSNTTVATVPASVTVAAGSTTATFTVTTKAVTSSTSVTISAAYGGVTRTATLTLTPQAPPPPPPSTDTVAVQVAEYSSGNAQLRVEASSTNASATLKVYVSSTNALIGTLRNEGGGRYRGDFAWSSNPQSITVRSSAGGSATRTVTVK
jgi:hypothetical protein